MDLTLYYFNWCPYCQKVLRFMKKNNIELSLADIHKDPANKAKLIEIGGKGQVPCLVINGTAMYESDDIINWMKENLITEAGS